VYLLQGNRLYLLSETGNIQVVLNTNNDQFIDFALDQHGNIWLWNYDKIAYWDHNDLILYSIQDSLSPDDKVNGLTVDYSGKVWVGSDYNLVKIDAGKWTIIPYNQITGLEGNVRLYNPISTEDNSVWFEIGFSTQNSIVRFKDETMTFFNPDTTKYSYLVQDAEGTLWAISGHYGFNEKGYTILLYSTLRYFHDEAWVDVDVSDIKQFINTVNVSESKILIGTNSGIVEKPRK
jgi:ligand-binding sensor domain-containing protein